MPTRRVRRAALGAQRRVGVEGGGRRGRRGGPPRGAGGLECNVPIVQGSLDKKPIQGVFTTKMANPSHPGWPGARLLGHFGDDLQAVCPRILGQIGDDL